MENKSGDNGKLNPEEQPKRPEVVKLTITISSKEGLQVEAPGDGKTYDEPMCYYLLEKAKDFIKSNNLAVAKGAAQKMIETPKHGIMDFARRFKR